MLGLWKVEAAMKYNAEYVRERVGGSHDKAVEVFKLVAMVYDHPTKAPSKTWERAIRLINKKSPKLYTA